MCDEIWERELARRMRMLAAEDELLWLDTVETEGPEARDEPLEPPLPLIEARRRVPHALVR